MLTVATTILTWIIGLFTIVLLWSGKSARHFAPAAMPLRPAVPYRPAPLSTSTMDGLATHQPVTDPWSTPSSQA